MTNAKTTKRAFLTSVVSLLICFSMLLGTTFAWFTDSAVSSNNVIKSGTLKVDLLMWNDETKKYEPIENGNAIFEAGEKEAGEKAQNSTKTLWEPGKTQVVYLAIENAGSLDLKYSVALDVTNTKANEANGKKLTDVLQYEITSGFNAENDDKLSAWNGTNAKSVVAGPQTIDVGGTTLTAGDTNYFALSVHMLGTASDDYQDLTVTFDLKVLATQLASESDSFGNTYDEKAPALIWDGTTPESIKDTTLEIVPDEANKTGTITVNSPEDLVYLPKLAEEWVSLYSNGEGTYVSNYYEKNGGKGGAYYYAWGWTIELGADLDMNNIPVDPIDTTFWGTVDGNGHTISNVVVDCPETGYAALFSVTRGLVKDLNVNNVKVSGKFDVGAVVGFCRGSMDNVHVTNATIEGGNYIGTVAGVVYGGITNSSATNSTVTATGMTVGGLAGYALVETSGNTAENVTVVGTYNVGGLLGQAQNETVADNTVKNVTVISTTEAIAEWGGECRTGEVAAFMYEASLGDNNTIENVTVQEWGGEMPETLVVTPDEANNTGTITVNTAEDLMYLNKLAENWVSRYSNGNGTNVGSYYVQNGGQGGAYYYNWGWTVKLGADIDLYNLTVDPINVSFWGTFDGQGHTIKNAKILTDSTTENSAGLFNANQCSVKNVKLDNIHVTGSNVGNSTAGVLSGSCNQGVDSVTITNSTVTGGKYTGGVVGYGYTDVTNCTLENVTVKGGYKLGGVIGYICASGTNTGEVTGNELTDCTVDGLGNGVYAGGKTQYIIGKVVGNYNCNGTCNNNTITNMTTSATANIGQIEAGMNVTQ